MKKRFSILVLSLLCFLVACQQEPRETLPDPEASQEEIQDENQGQTQEGSPEESQPGEGLKFQAETFTGDPLHSDIFADYDLTVINIWATWCGPCVREMPDLQELFLSLPENVNFFTLCHDAESQRDLAEEILAQSGATFETISPNPQIEEQILAFIRAFPSTLFVDRQGEILGILEGAPPSDVVESYRSVIDDLLMKMEENHGENS